MEFTHRIAAQRPSEGVSMISERRRFIATAGEVGGKLSGEGRRRLATAAMLHVQ